MKSLMHISNRCAFRKIANGAENFISSVFKVKVKIKVKVTLRLTVSQSVCLGVKPKSGTFDQRFVYFLFFLF
jgi:hypothetical protein